jgi:hypothetical protein
VQNLSIFYASLRQNYQTYRGLEPIWFYTTVGLLGLTMACFLAGSIDDRLFNGVSVWAKPFKFALSLAVFFATLLVFVRYLPSGYLQRGVGRLIAVSLVWVALAEMVYITISGALGEASHFNVTTPFREIMYMLMGIGATWLVTAPLWFAWIIGRNNVRNDPIVLAIIIGLVLTFVLGGGFGQYLGSQTGHWVDAAASDANGVWLFNWAKSGGDLRVAHFFGMHAMQVVPLFALLLPKHWSRGFACSLVVLFSGSYTVVSVLTFVQAVRGQPFIS